MKSFKVHVQIGEYYGGYDSVMGGKGAFRSMEQFETIVQARDFSQATKVAQAQYGGPSRCIVHLRCEVK